MVEVLSRLSDDLAQIVDGAGPAVVRVEARRRLPASGVIWSSEGVIVSAHHAVARDENIKVGLPDGATFSATLAGRDPTTDIAVLRVQATGLEKPQWAGLDDVRVGHLVLALGRPGESVLATLGIVSALGESWRTSAGGLLDRYLQTDLVMYPGFSGGPLVSSGGQVLGLNTSSLLRGIALAVPTSTLDRVVEALLSHGRVRRGYLGVGAQPVRLPAGLAEQVNQETGLLLVSVEPGGPAEKAGLVLGDTIVTLNGQPTRHLDDLLALLGSESIDTALPAGVLRGGSIQQFTVKIGDHK